MGISLAEPEHGRAQGLRVGVLRARRRAYRVGPLDRGGTCDSCGRRAAFLVCSNRSLKRRMALWPYESPVLDALATRENYFCFWCGRNFRMRMVAAVAEPAIEGADVYRARSVRRLYGTPASAGEFVPLLRVLRRRDSGRFDTRASTPRTSHVVTFAESSFDLVLTSELFEHVVDPWRGFAEVRRVLRPRRSAHLQRAVHRPTAYDRAGPASQTSTTGTPSAVKGLSSTLTLETTSPEQLDHHGFRTSVHEFPATVTGCPGVRLAGRVTSP